MVATTPTQTCLGWKSLAKASLGTMALTMMIFLVFQEVVVTELASRAQAPSLFPPHLSQPMVLTREDWDCKPSLEGAAFGYGKGLPDLLIFLLKYGNLFLPSARKPPS